VVLCVVGGGEGGGRKGEGGGVEAGKGGVGLAALKHAIGLTRPSSSLHLWGAVRAPPTASTRRPGRHLSVFKRRVSGIGSSELFKSNLGTRNLEPVEKGRAGGDEEGQRGNTES
jgi:hypothetical protein